MNQAQECLLCYEKDEIIIQLKQEIAQLKVRLEKYEPYEIPQQEQQEDQKVQIIQENEETCDYSNLRQSRKQTLLQESFIQMYDKHQLKQSSTQEFPQENHYRSTTQTHLHRQLTSTPNHAKSKIGDKFFEQFLIFGPDLDQLDNLIDEKSDQGEIMRTVAPKTLYHYPPQEDNLDQIFQEYAFPNNVQIKKLPNENFQRDVLPKLKEILMVTQCVNNGDNEFVFVTPREDLMEKSQKGVTQFIQESNPNVFRYVICLEMTEFYCNKQNNTVWVIPIIFAFVTYFPFIKFFLKQNAYIWNQIKIERLIPMMGLGNDALKYDLKFMIDKMSSLLNHLILMRSFPVDFDKKFELTKETTIRAPNKERAKYVQLQWGSTKTFSLLSFKELNSLISQIMIAQRVLVFSKSKSLLCHVMLTIISLIYPFMYLNPLCFLLPESQICKVGAPQNIFFGIVGEYADYAETIREWQQDDITFVDLDNRKVYYSENQSRDNIAKLRAPLKRIKHLRNLYEMLNPSKTNFFSMKQSYRKGSKQQKLERLSTTNYREIEIEIAKQFQEFWQKNIINQIPLERRFMKPGAGNQVDLNLVSKLILKRSSSNDLSKFLAQFLESPTFTGFLDDLYEKSTVRFFVQSEIDAAAKLEIKAKEGDVVADSMKQQKVPLAFECGFNCSCSTCSVKLGSSDFNKLQELQPQTDEEKNVLETEGKTGRIRLTCQLKVAPELDGMILYI